MIHREKRHHYLHNLALKGLGVGCFKTILKVFSFTEVKITVQCLYFFFPGYVSDALRQAQVKVVDQSICSGLGVYGAFITPRMICAGSMTGGLDSCQV